MALHLVTGYAGEEHITSADQGAYNMATFGEGEYVLDRGNKFEATIVSNNLITIADGEAMMQGRFIKMFMGTSEEVTIENGTQEMNRNDLICIRYEKNGTTSIENASIVVKKGTETSGTPEDPAYITGDITDGSDLVNEMPLYRVKLEGLNITGIDTLYLLKQKDTGFLLEKIPLDKDMFAFTINSGAYSTMDYISTLDDFSVIKQKYSMLFYEIKGPIQLTSPPSSEDILKWSKTESDYLILDNFFGGNEMMVQRAFARATGFSINQASNIIYLYPGTSGALGYYIRCNNVTGKLQIAASGMPATHNYVTVADALDPSVKRPLYYDCVITESSVRKLYAGFSFWGVRK